MRIGIRSLKGRVRQRRSLLFSQIENQVNISAKYVREHHISVEEACKGKSDKFEILILASFDDLPLAKENAKRTKELYGDQILRTTIVSQGSHDETSNDFVFITDEELGVSYEVSKTLRIFGDRANWMKQQYLKSKFVYQAHNPVLIIDSDTFLQVPIKWKKKGRQILLVNIEDFHTPYNLHILHFLGITAPFLNFVSHIQLQEPAIVREIYSSDFDRGWQQWARTAWKFGEDSPASEFQTYAAYLLTKTIKVSIVFPKHMLLDANGKSLREVLDCELSRNSDVATVGQKLRLLPDSD